MSDFSKKVTDGIKATKEYAKKGAEKVTGYLDILSLENTLKDLKEYLEELYCNYGKKAYLGMEDEDLKSEIAYILKNITDIAEEIEAAQAELNKESNEVVYCSKCGAKLETSDFFCKKCGTKIKKF